MIIQKIFLVMLIFSLIVLPVTAINESTEPPVEEPELNEIIDEPTEEPVPEPSVNETETTVEEPTNEDQEIPANETEVPIDEPINNSILDNSTELPLEEPMDNTTENPVEGIIEEPLVNPPEEGFSLLGTILNLLLEKTVAIKDELINIQAQLFYDNSSPIAEQSIDFYVGSEKIGTQTTDESGLAVIDWDTSPFSPGAYLVDIDYAGNGILESSYDSANITLKESVEEVVNDTLINQTLENVTEVFENVTEVINDTVNETLLNETLPQIGPVELVQDCTEISWDEEEDIMGTCIGEGGIVCDDEPFNTSCTMNTYEYNCKTGTQTVQKTRQECATKGLIINNGIRKVKLDTANYECSTEEVGPKITVTCDSKFDGNGDGICTSGESCQKFVVDGSAVEEYEKNSADDFLDEDEDESFFLTKATKEILE